MELTDLNVLQTLLRPMRRHRAHSGSQSQPKLESTDTTRTSRPPVRPRCMCGECARCLEHARWERVFEKFADPTYYVARSVTQGSSLAGI